MNPKRLPRAFDIHAAASLHNSGAQYAKALKLVSDDVIMNQSRTSNSFQHQYPFK